MNELDRSENYRRFDPGNFIEHFIDFPSQCEQAWQEIKRVVLPSYYLSLDKVVIVGMGGSAIGGEVLKGFVEERCQIPVEVIRDYSVPGYVDKNTLLIASTYSGNTEETLSACSQALSKKAKIIVISTDGKITQWAQSYKLPLYQFHYQTEPRQAFGFSFVSLLGIFDKLGFIDVKEDYQKAILLLKNLQNQLKPEVPTTSNQAKQLAGELYNKMVIVFGAGHLRAVARRFKTQLNENAKQMAFWEELPEACHNFIVGLNWPKKLSEEVFLLLLDSKFVHPRIMLRYTVIQEIFAKANIPFRTIRMNPATDPLTELLSLIYLLDFVSYYLAILNKVDPREIENIRYLKQKLEEERWPK